MKVDVFLSKKKILHEALQLARSFFYFLFLIYKYVCVCVYIYIYIVVLQNSKLNFFVKK